MEVTLQPLTRLNIPKELIFSNTVYSQNLICTVYTDLSEKCLKLILNTLALQLMLAASLPS